MSVGGPSLRSFISFLMPGGLLFAAVVFLVHQQNFPQWLPILQRTYPYAVLGIALLLGWRFDRSRLVFAAVIIALGERSLSIFSTRGGNVGAMVFDLAAVLLPLNLMLLALAKERGIFTWHGISRWGFILAQPLVIGLLIHYKHGAWLMVLERDFIPLPFLQGLPLEQSGLLAFTVAAIILAINSLHRRSALETGFFWAVALLFYAMLSVKPGGLHSIYFTTAVLILVIAVIESSYTMAYRDELTGLPARRALNHTLLKLGSRYTVAMLDIDHFKKFNDRYGHDVGDQVLKMVASKMSRVTGGGKAYRYGGEEFTVLFTGKHVDDVLPHLESLRQAVETAEFTVRRWNRPRRKPESPPKRTTKQSDKRVTVTISIGVAERDDRNRSTEEVIKAADKALYRAKKGGRNQVSK